MPSSWAVKRISSTSGGGNKGSENTKFNNALAKDSSEPGESEVLWIQPEAGGCDLSILNYKRLCPCVCNTILHDHPTLSLVVRIKHLNAPSQCSYTALNI